MGAIIAVQELVKRYVPENVTAVDGVSFQIEEGEIFSLLGPNGAGKTTTISMLSCLLKPTSGDAQVDGHSIVRDAMAVKRAIGVVPQDIALYDTLSARQNLAFWGQMYGLGGSALKQRVAEVLEQIGLADKADAAVRTYSGGMKRRVNIGVGLLHRPRVIYMDEPTVGIDPQSRRNILDTVKELNRQGMTVLYTTHYMEEAQELSDRVGIIDHGKLIAIGTQKELTQMVGEHETLRLHVGEGENTAGLVEALRTLPDTIQVSATEGQVVLIVPEAEDALPGAITRANELGVRVRSVDMEEPNLEAVFLHLTGRALRD
jgi:ABC-2 type transport system ATP-binding protein